MRVGFRAGYDSFHLLTVPPILVLVRSRAGSVKGNRDELLVGIPAQTPLARLHEILQPLVIYGRMNHLAMVQLRHRYFRAYCFQQDADLLFARKSPTARSLSRAKQSACVFSRTG
jgi:hypothetical protein